MASASGGKSLRNAFSTGWPAPPESLSMVALPRSRGVPCAGRLPVTPWAYATLNVALT